MKDYREIAIDYFSSTCDLKSIKSQVEGIESSQFVIGDGKSVV